MEHASRIESVLSGIEEEEDEADSGGEGNCHGEAHWTHR
jgi:hypothetical protein